MAFSSISSSLTKSAQAVTRSSPSAPTNAAPKTSFADVKANLERSNAFEVPKSVLTLQNRMAAGAEISPRELFSAQISMQRFGLRVELVSKSVESVTASLKRLQQQQ